MDSKTVSLVVMKAAVVLFFLHKLLPIVGANMPMTGLQKGIDEQSIHLISDVEII